MNGNVVFFTIGTNSPAIWALSNSQFDPQTYLASIEDGSFMAQANGTQFFRGKSPDGQQVGLWATNGTSVGFVPDFKFGSGNAINSTYTYPNSTAYKSRLYFNASTPGAYAQPWRSGGTESGTLSVADINPTSDSYPTNFTVSGDTLYVVAEGGATKGYSQIYSTTEPGGWGLDLHL